MPRSVLRAGSSSLVHGRVSLEEAFDERRGLTSTSKKKGGKKEKKKRRHCPSLVDLSVSSSLFLFPSDLSLLPERR
jgi:hypothetical protein